MVNRPLYLELEQLFGFCKTQIRFFKWAKPGLFFFLFLFFSHDKYSTNTINEKA